MSKKKDFTLIIDIFSWNFDVSANFDQLSRKKISKKLGFTPVLGKKSNYRVKINIIESRGSPAVCLCICIYVRPAAQAVAPAPAAPPRVRRQAGDARESQMTPRRRAHGDGKRLCSS